MTATTLQALDGASIDGGWYTSVTDFAHSTHWLNAPMLAYTSYGAILFITALLACWWTARQGSAAAMAASLAAGLAAVLAYAVNSGIKDAFAEPRPCRALPHAFLVEACPAPTDYAFPSNHTTVAFAAAAALLLIHRRVGIALFAAAVLMAASRVYVGAHYPHDVITAALLGIAIALPTVLLGRRYGAPAVERLRAGRLRPLLAK
ncbi:phosphatase PAP2 family protein [Streptomyces sp. H39-S7]|uniref:phosphatase PAP2 family protein n=1 Tax=Streptomyces sp. H39-S7 TaxID=3004357 RepID=UPI0022AFD22D|nr:phosphatase PAP2 family protein [Streptomyces sp. H39-S7]MCZ4124045.1 phosphatase PAP2 family protein [Streptomyces sp. H39-S7]